MAKLSEFEAQQIRRASLADYHAFMRLNASFGEIRDALRGVIPVDWAGCTKSDIANAYAIRDYHLATKHYDALLKQFGGRKGAKEKASRTVSVS